MKGVATRPLLSLDDLTKDCDDPKMASKALNHFFDHMRKQMVAGEKELKIPYFGRFKLKKNGKLIK